MMNIRFKNLFREEQYCKFICLSLIYLYVINMTNGFSGFINISISTISVVFKSIIGIYFVLLLPGLLRHFTKNMFFMVWVSVMIALINYAVFPNNQMFFSETMFTFFTMCFPLALTAMAITNIDYLSHCLLITARTMAVISIPLLAGVFSRRIYTDSYSMGLGYAILTPILILICHLIKENRKKWYDIVCLVTLLVILISYGSRGPVLAVLLFVVFYLLRFYFEQRKYYAVIFVILGAIIIASLYVVILDSIGEVLTEFGINSRTINMLTGSTIKQTNKLSGRNLLWTVLISEIRKNPFAIRGINAEWRVIGFYAHNLIIELIYQFGIIVGGIVVLWIGYTIVYQLVNKDHSIGNEICIILMFSTIPGLMLSNSLWISSSFWLWVGVSSGKRNSCISKEGSV